MDRTKVFIKNFNIRMLLMRIVLNMLALMLTVGVIPNIYFVDKRLIVWLAMALALGVLNAFVKPIIQVLTLRFIFATAGLVLVLINAVILWLLGALFPQYIAIDGLLAALLGGAVLGLSATLLESLLGLSQPIVSEKYPEIRERVRDRQFYRTQAELMRLETQKGGLARELAVTKAVMASSQRPITSKPTPAAPGAAADGPAPIAATAATQEIALAPDLTDMDANKMDVAVPEESPQPVDAAKQEAA